MWLFEGYWIYLISGIILLPGIAVTIWAQVRVNSTFAKYNQIRGQKGITGAEITHKILTDNGLYDTQIVMTKGHLTDHYDPRTRTIALSEDVYRNSSLAAMGVAAHEAGHALQYKTNYFPIKVRTALIPLLNFSSSLMWPLVLIGFFFTFLAGGSIVGDVLLLVGVGVYTLAVLFQLCTLPVEFNASKRAYRQLTGTHALSVEEAKGAKKVLNAAALTYVAALLTSILTLFRFLFIIFAARGRRN